MPDTRTRLTDALVDRLPPATTGQYLVRDIEQPGFFVVVGKRSKTYTVQGDLRRGRSRKSLRISIGRHGDADLSARLARAHARELLGRIARGEDPAEPQRGADGPTLREAWQRYEEAHLRRKGRSAGTISGYHDHVHRVMKDWLDVPLAKLGNDPRLVAERHDALTRKHGPYCANGAMRTLRAIYNHARKTAPKLPATNPASLVDWNAEKRRDTGMGAADLPAWWAQVLAIRNPVRRAFHLFSLLSGSRPDALLRAEWRHVSVRRRVLHVPTPKGGAKKAFDIPLSKAMIRCLAYARREGRKWFPYEAGQWVFPSDGPLGHMVEHKERRAVLSKWGNDLRQTYRTLAQAAGLSEFDAHLLMNHSLPGVNAGYITKSKLTDHLREQQEVLSRYITERLRG